ncbi:hypothetical protein ACHWQZ_G011068 [Mnemiopsis leidyi]
MYYTVKGYTFSGLMKRDQLIPGVEPPVRLITALQEGISKKSDVFVATKYLRPLEKDFCQDLLSDTTDALVWLDQIDQNKPMAEKKTYRPFTFDFKGLYDSLSPSLVIEALQHAMDQLRPDWSMNFKSWLIDLVNHSLKSSIGFFENCWYKQIHGVPTGGSLCVQLANIAVFYVLNKEVYSNPTLMGQVASVKRYIDDGAGQFTGTTRQFSTWINKVNENIAPYGLEIDEFQVENTAEYVSFLDVQFTFNLQGQLQTDLHVKETDSRSYLHFSSSHPNHIFSGIVYSQCLRLRRIINSNERLEAQLNILKGAFLESGYPKKMVENIATKVLSMERMLTRKKVDTPAQQTPLPAVPIRVISSYGSDNELVSVVQKYEDHLRRTRSFSESEYQPAPSTTSSAPKGNNKLFQFVKKTGSTLRSRLVTSKQLALGAKHGKTEPCQRRNCKCCSMILSKDSITTNGKRIRSAPGNCKTYNIIYLVQCSICKKNYVGRTINNLHKRMDGHRSKFYEIIDGRAVDITSDEYSLGVHLVDHGLGVHTDFNETFRTFILENCSPSALEVKENNYIHLLNSLRPFGLNTVNPFGLPIFHKPKTGHFTFTDN